MTTLNVVAFDDNISYLYFKLRFIQMDNFPEAKAPTHQREQLFYICRRTVKGSKGQTDRATEAASITLKIFDLVFMTQW